VDEQASESCQGTTLGVMPSSIFANGASSPWVVPWIVSGLNDWVRGGLSNSSALSGIALLWAWVDAVGVVGAGGLMVVRVTTSDLNERVPTGLRRQGRGVAWAIPETGHGEMLGCDVVSSYQRFKQVA